MQLTFPVPTNGPRVSSSEELAGSCGWSVPLGGYGHFRTVSTAGVRREPNGKQRFTIERALEPATREPTAVR